MPTLEIASAKCQIVIMDFDAFAERRLPVWTALSELFLDTELLESDIQRIAAEIRNSGCTLQEAETILRNEVSPVFSSNLLSIAGEWAGWSAEDIRHLIERSFQRKHSGRFVDRLRSYFSLRIIPHDWIRVAALLD